jgi:decaprenylphospho-beta-D-ribofuranose 2-oxidase
MNCSHLKELHGWGRYPRQMVRTWRPCTATECAATLECAAPLIATGLARSYGDSAMANRVLNTQSLDNFIAFDADTGELICESGVSLDAILRTFVPRGWFLPVTPGSRFVTVGGAIASDVHGKNHHGAGTFGQHIQCLTLLLGNGEIVSASPTENADLFAATCGGMGLTGLILKVTLTLKRISSSNILQTTLKVQNLQAALDAFEQHSASTYSVAWIDCLAKGENLGRSLLMLGEHASDEKLHVQTKSPFTVPLDFPAALLNRASVQAFNSLYYNRICQHVRKQRVPFESYFYPLDTIGQWNRLYGKPGFVQYQFVLPQAAGVSGLREVLAVIAASGRGSFLSVLKVFGAANANYLSFPQAGYTLALDFKVEPAVFELLNRLDAIVMHHGGRLYLAKDARMSESTFKASYSNWQVFEEVRAKWHAHGNFASSQSRRLGLL